MELMTAMKAVDQRHDGGVAAVTGLTFRCVALDKDNRPDAKEIVGEIRRIKNCTRTCECEDGMAKNWLLD
ncbi:hypothetical protein F2Q69_00051250 [Brassica cretica]|uniref:Uncharacterized protein n=1 Tax=Brassica cretica TaxID=69181 RepID=A0A8S9PTJ8_BRACR|nr:hypothetical protein F2Q69_00051250 [Brassica cretica]